MAPMALSFPGCISTSVSCAANWSASVLCLRQQHGSAGVCQIGRVMRLVVIDGMRQRDQQCRQTGSRQLADSQRARPADDQIGKGIGCRHVRDEWGHLSRHSGLPVALGCNLRMLPAGLVKHLRTQLGRQLGQRCWQQLVQGLSAQAATQHQQPRLASAQRLARRFQEQLFTHRIAR